MDNLLCQSCIKGCKQLEQAVIIECPHYCYNGLNLPKEKTALSSYRELTTEEKRAMKALITSMCANYEGLPLGYSYYKECFLTGTQCPMLLKHYHNGNVCRYFKEAVLPTHAELEESLFGTNNTNKECPICKKRFYSETNKKYCSDFCTQKAKKEADKQRAKKYRKNKG